MHCLDKVTNSFRKKNGLLLHTKLCINFILGLACCDPNQCWQTHQILLLPVFCTSTKLSLLVHSIFYNTEVSRQTTVYFWNTLILTCLNYFLPFKDNVFIYFRKIFVIHWTQICLFRFSHPALYYSQLHLS